MNDKQSNDPDTYIMIREMNSYSNFSSQNNESSHEVIINGTHIIISLPPLNSAPPMKGTQHTNGISTHELNGEWNTQKYDFTETLESSYQSHEQFRKNTQIIHDMKIKELEKQLEDSKNEVDKLSSQLHSIQKMKCHKLLYRD